MTPSNHAVQRPVIASRLQSDALVGRVTELGSLGVTRSQVFMNDSHQITPR